MSVNSFTDWLISSNIILIAWLQFIREFSVTCLGIFLWVPSETKIIWGQEDLCHVMLGGVMLESFPPPFICVETMILTSWLYVLYKMNGFSFL